MKRKLKRTKVRRILRTSTVNYRGKLRLIVAEIDTTTGTLSVRPHGCRKSKIYALADLFAWGPQLQLNLK